MTEVGGSPEELARQLGHLFADGRLLSAALTHRSWVNEHSSYQGEDNQRLEFLGDAVVQLVVSQELMGLFPGAPEGRLTKLRARVVHTGGLAAIAQKLELGRYLRLGRGELRSGGRDKSSILADAFEALAGALFLDEGFEGTRAVLLPMLQPLLDELFDDPSRLDAKSRLQEITQGRGQGAPHYALVDADGPEHARRFRVQVLLNGVLLGAGVGPTKKAAEQAAAGEALRSRVGKSGENGQ